MRSFFMVAGIVSFGLLPTAQAMPSCSIVQLLAPDSGRLSAAYGINNSGAVVGTAAYAGVGGWHATRWYGNKPVPLERSIDSLFSWARSVNDLGQSVGYRETASFRPVIWNGTKARELSYTGFVGGRAMSINNYGRVIGVADLRTDLGIEPRAVIWRKEEIRVLTTPVGTTTEALDINDRDQVVGNTYRADGTFATLWSGAGMRYLDFSGNSVATAINNDGHIVGYSGTTGAHIATLWRNRTPFYLPSLLTDTYAYAINNNGYIVGSSGGRAVIWDGTMVVRDLNDCINPYYARAGWILSSAHGINDRGEIIGTMVNVSGSVEPRAFKLKTSFR